MIRATRTVSHDDPQPQPHTCFGDPKHVAKIAETKALSVASSLPASKSRPQSSESSQDKELVLPADWHPQRLIRTVLSSMAESKDFGQQMTREAKRRQFGEVTAKAFLGDGLPWNCREFIPKREH